MRHCTMSRLDHIYRSILLTKFFTKGWGDPEKLKRIFQFRKIISNRETCQHLVSSDYPVHIDKEQVSGDVRILSGHFKCPLVQYVPDIVPKEVETARFEVILPKTWKSKLRPICLHLAGTGDHGFMRRRVLLARPLLAKSGIASIILENPYYGVRKPKQQLRSSLHNVSDLFVMGGALVLESLALFHWCEREGLGPLGITGISMGGFMASLAATNWHKPLSLVPCLSWSTASTVFTQGVMSGAIPWKLLQDQYSTETEYRAEVAKLIESPEQNARNKAFQMGRDFAKDYPDKMADIDQFHDELLKNKQDLSTETVMDSKLEGEISSGQIRVKISPQAQYHTLSTNHLDKKYIFNSNPKYSTSASGELVQRPAKRLIQLVKYALRHQKNQTADKKSHNSRITQQEALDFMRGVMDECTHIGNFSVPVDPRLIIIVSAKYDAYVPRDSVLNLQELWPGSEVRFIDAGHIASFLLHQDVFRSAITDAFDRQIKLYYQDL